MIKCQRCVARLLSLLSVVLLLLLGACTAVDLGSIETAEIVKQNQVSIKGFTNAGIAMESMIKREDAGYQNVDNDSASREKSTALLTGVSLGFGVSPDLELGGRVWVSGASLGGKAYAKMQMSNDGTNSVALIPALTYSYSDGDEFDVSSTAISSSRAFGLELQLLRTIRYSKGLASTFAIRGNYHNYTEYLANYASDEVQYNVIHGGARGNVRFGSKLYLILEGGFEVIPRDKIGECLVPTFSIAMGFE